jgi:hypothetical protein
MCPSKWKIKMPFVSSSLKADNDVYSLSRFFMKTGKKMVTFFLYSLWYYSQIVLSKRGETFGRQNSVSRISFCHEHDKRQKYTRIFITSWLYWSTKGKKTRRYKFIYTQTMRRERFCQHNESCSQETVTRELEWDPKSTLFYSHHDHGINNILE